MFLYGDQHKPHHVVILLANILAFLEFIAVNAKLAIIYVLMKELYKTLTSPDGTTWMNGVARENWNFVPALAMHVQNVFLQFTMVAKNWDNIMRMKNGHTIDANPLEFAINNATRTINEIKSNIASGNPGPYGTSPPILSCFVSEKTNNNHNKREASDKHRDAHDKKKFKSGKPLSNITNIQDPGNQDALLKQKADQQKGMLKYSGTGSKPPMCNVTFERPDGKGRDRMCMPFATQGFFCTYGNTKCKFLHVVKLSYFKKDNERKDFCKWVENTSDITFAPGHGPSPGTD
jgi:hypothetical protein